MFELFIYALIVTYLTIAIHLLGIREQRLIKEHKEFLDSENEEYFANLVQE